MHHLEVYEQSLKRNIGLGIVNPTFLNLAICQIINFQHLNFHESHFDVDTSTSDVSFARTVTMFAIWIATTCSISFFAASTDNMLVRFAAKPCKEKYLTCLGIFWDNFQYQKKFRWCTSQWNGSQHYIQCQSFNHAEPSSDFEITNMPDQKEARYHINGFFWAVLSFGIFWLLMKHSHCGLKYASLTRFGPGTVYKAVSWVQYMNQSHNNYLNLYSRIAMNARSSSETLEATSVASISRSFSEFRSTTC